ncbi:phosphotransferase [Microbacterium tumbae]
MSGWDARLSPAQREWAAARLPDASLVEDMSWGLVESIVLHVRTSQGDAVVKAGDASNHHVGREISAHPMYTAGLIATGHAARLIDAEPALRVMILDHLPGILVEGTDAELREDTHRQAGELLRRLHAESAREDDDYEARTTARALSWFETPNRVDPAMAREARRILETTPSRTARAVPTHGDWQPRNWLIDEGIVRVIDFGRFAFRPAATDLTRLAAQQWRSRPELEAAFFEGYGPDPRDPAQWRLEALKEAIGTACWAFQVGDEEFEAQGHRMLAEALAAF